MRVTTVLKKLLELCKAAVIWGRELREGERPQLVVWGGPGCGGGGSLWGHRGVDIYDQGNVERRWRRLDVDYATCEFGADSWL